MRFQNRLALAGLTVFAASVVGFVAFAAPASANVSPGPEVAATQLTAATVPVGTATPTTEEAKKKKDPCEGGAALDSESGKWRATVSCDDWVGVLPGSYDTQQEALDAGEGWANGVNRKVMDGPGCLPPFVLC